jgi:hypothetical protein
MGMLKMLPKYQPGDKIRTKTRASNQTLTGTVFQICAETAQDAFMYEIRVDNSHTGWYPNNILRYEDELEKYEI